ncbi:glycosyltransferase family 2 protein [Clostridium hydrogenum]|uniref:glycosyltransferase family 2 protein n=1 Tax=Clostridium hydrogenum TaxID=2855764 RepID=UPI001F22BE8B|nr:glycosyltransferase family 2 protein [Clostridium hydrogenum]
MDNEITVVIPSYNPGKYLVKAIQSIYDQTYKDWKLIVVDDGSTDNSLELAKDLLNNPKIEVIKNTTNLGQSKTQNIALQAITTPYFVQLDSDDWFSPDAVETLLNEFKKQPEDVAVVSGNIMIINEESGYLRSHDNIPSTKIKKGRFFKDKYDYLLSNLSLWPRCFRTSAVKKVGGWPTDDSYEGRHMEDKMILYRLSEEYRFYWIDKVMYYHRRHDNNITNNLELYNELIETNVRKILKRWGDEYTPVFEISYGWKGVKELIKN